MSELSRRQVLAGSSGVMALLALAACRRNSPESGNGGASGEGGSPRRGGTLRVGALGKSSALTKDPHDLLNNNSDFLLMSLVYDALTVPPAKSGDAAVAPRLATSWKVAEDAKTWTFELAKDAKFHDGSPVTAEDVVWSLQRIITDKKAAFKVPVPADAITAVDAHTVRLVADAPSSQLPLFLRLVTFTMKKGTTDLAAFNGSGPYRLDSYNGGNARLVRNEAWHGGAAPLDRIEITRFESTDAMSNAVQSGQIDLAAAVGPIGARIAERQPNLQVSRRPHDVAMPIIMRVADGPFADRRVRQALKLAVDRKAMVAQVLSGFGSVANDVLGTADPLYDKSLPQRTRDLEQAKKLLAEANFDLTQRYPLYTIDEAFGEVDSAKLFAQQVKEIGVQIDVVVQESGVFYEQTWCKAPLYTMYWGTNDSVAFFAQKVMASGSKTNETGWANKEFDAAYGELLAATERGAQEKAAHAMQRQVYEDSGYLLWGMGDGVEVATKAVRGLPTSPGFGWVLLDRVWLAG